MEDAAPCLRSVAAEIETPAQSPRSGAASPSAGAAPSGDSFTRAFMHQARRLRGVVLNQKARTPACLDAFAPFLSTTPGPCSDPRSLPRITDCFPSGLHHLALMGG